MYAKNVTKRTLYYAALKTGVDFRTEDWKSPTKVIFTLKLGPVTQYASVNPITGRKVGGGVCYHGHYAFLRELFELCPDAEVGSTRFGVVKYTAENFTELAEEYGNTQRGSFYEPYLMREACNCERD